jgi:predicted acyltransferase
VGRTIHLWFPINKKLWTSSFVLLTAGLALICLAACYWMADVKQLRGRWTKPILVFGTNAIAAYFFAEVLAHALSRFRLNGGMSLQEYIYSHFFAPLASPPNASLLYALVYLTLCWTAMFFLYRKGITVKI